MWSLALLALLSWTERTDPCANTLPGHLHFRLSLMSPAGWSGEAAELGLLRIEDEWCRDRDGSPVVNTAGLLVLAFATLRDTSRWSGAAAARQAFGHRCMRIDAQRAAGCMHALSMAAHCGVHPECLSGRWWLIDLLGADTLSTWRNSPSDAILSRGGPEGDGESLNDGDGESAPPAVDGGRGLSDDEIAAEAALARDAKVAAATAAANGVGEAELREILRGRPTLEDLQNPRKPTEADMRAGFERHARAMWPRKVVPPHPGLSYPTDLPDGQDTIAPDDPMFNPAAAEDAAVGRAWKAQQAAEIARLEAEALAAAEAVVAAKWAAAEASDGADFKADVARAARHSHRLSAVAAETLREASAAVKGSVGAGADVVERIRERADQSEAAAKERAAAKAETERRAAAAAAAEATFGSVLRAAEVGARGAARARDDAHARVAMAEVDAAAADELLADATAEAGEYDDFEVGEDDEASDGGERTPPPPRPAGEARRRGRRGAWRRARVRGAAAGGAKAPPA